MSIRIFTKDHGKPEEMRCIGFYVHDPESVLHAIIHFSSLLKNNKLDGVSQKLLSAEREQIIKFYNALHTEQ